MSWAFFCSHFWLGPCRLLRAWQVYPTTSSIIVPLGSFLFICDSPEPESMFIPRYVCAAPHRCVRRPLSPPPLVRRSMSVALRLSACLLVCLPACLPVCLSVCLPVSLPVRLLACLSVKGETRSKQKVSRLWGGGILQRRGA